MNNLKRLNKAMEYIEANLANEIDMKAVGKIALCSEFHFSKMFSYLADMQLSEYIRNRRMSLAAVDIKNTNMTVMDAAVKYQYNSADAFSRAFKNVHGILPSKARGSDVMFKSYPSLNFEINITGGIEMEYRIVEKPGFNLVGFKKRVTIKHNGVNPEIMEMYQNLSPEIIGQLKQALGRYLQVVGLSLKPYNKHGQRSTGNGSLVIIMIQQVVLNLLGMKATIQQIQII